MAPTLGPFSIIPSVTAMHRVGADVFRSRRVTTSSSLPPLRGSPAAAGREKNALPRPRIYARPSIFVESQTFHFAVLNTDRYIGLFSIRKNPVKCTSPGGIRALGCPSQPTDPQSAASGAPTRLRGPTGNRAERPSLAFARGAEETLLVKHGRIADSSLPDTDPMGAAGTQRVIRPKVAQSAPEAEPAAHAAGASTRT